MLFRSPQAPSAEAERFMDWLLAGLADGSLHFNDQSAMVHFVPEGMLLVSPRIFRVFARRWGEEPWRRSKGASGGDAEVGKAIQLQVLRAGWHVLAGPGVNILTYQVMSGDAPVSRLSGVVIRQPERFVTSVPPANPRLVRDRKSTRLNSSHSQQSRMPSSA